jgi:virulence-associated protein VagC
MAERARIITLSGSQAVELPDACRFPEGEREVLVYREGKRIILELVEPAESVDEWSPEFLAVLGSLKDEEIPLARRRPITEIKDPFE